MSAAGTRSWRGDEFQLRVALHYLIRLLNDDIDELQVEVSSVPGQDTSVAVDDIVAFLKDGKREYIQAKKNQPEHGSWKLSDRSLQEELRKARTQLEDDAQGTVLFYSRSPFGEFQKLVEESRPYPDHAAFERDASEGLKTILSKLVNVVGCSESATFNLLRRMNFGVARSFEEWDKENDAVLARSVPSSATARNVLERFLASHHAHLRESKHVISRDDVLHELRRHGLAPAPLYADQETLSQFRDASQIGRSWPRDIAGTRLPRQELEVVLTHLRDGAKTVLLAAGPGTGKTCLLLDIVDELESLGETAVLFLKGDRFADVSDETQLQESGLPRDIIGRCARLAASRPVVVLLDSLDVLSIGRNHASLRLFLGLLERLENLSGVSVVAACRDFDLKYDPHLRSKTWQKRVPLALLDFNDAVAPLLEQWNVDPNALSSEMRQILSVPQHLRLFQRLIGEGPTPDLISPFQLYDAFIHEVVTRQPDLGDTALRSLEDLAASGVHQRRQTFPRATMDATEEVLQRLISGDILIETGGGSLAFAHQTIAESLAVRGAVRQGQTLADFILCQPALPFMRPTVRAFFFRLRNQDKNVFRQQVWVVLDHSDIAYHLKRLVAESLAETFPDDDDWRLIRRFFAKQPKLFQRTMAQARNDAWFDLFRKHWLPHVRHSDGATADRYQYIGALGRWLKSRPHEVIELWIDALETGWGPDGSTWRISIALLNLSNWNAPTLGKLFALLVAKGEDREGLSKPLSAWVSATDAGDELLWRLVTRGEANGAGQESGGRRTIQCESHSFHDRTFLLRRLERSDELLSLAIEYLEASTKQVAGLSLGCLHKTSWERRHTKCELRSADGSTMLLRAMEQALKTRAKGHDSWWQTYEPRLRRSKDLGIRYLLLETYQETPSENNDGIGSQLMDPELFRHEKMDYELGVLMAASYGYLADGVQDHNQEMILALYDDHRAEDGSLPRWAARRIYELAIWVPRSFRTPEVDKFMSRWEVNFGTIRPNPSIYMSGGTVGAPISRTQLANLDETSFLRILRHYLGNNFYETEQLDQGGLVGGLGEVQRIVRECAAHEPSRFLNKLQQDLDDELTSKFGPSILEGVADHLRYVAGSLSAPEGWKEDTASAREENLAIALLQHVETTLPNTRPIFKESEYTLSRVLQGVADTLECAEDAERLTLALWRLVDSKDPEPEPDEEAVDLRMVSLNSVRGVAASSAMSLCCRWLERDRPVPRSLGDLLLQFASDASSGVRFSVLDRLPFLTHHDSKIGWALFGEIFREPQGQLWTEAEDFLFYQCRESLERVKPLLERISNEAPEVAGETYGRVITLCHLANHDVSLDQSFLALASSDAICRGIAQVLCTNLGDASVAERCRATLVEMLQQSKTSGAAVTVLSRAMASERADRVMDPQLVLLTAGALEHSGERRDTWGLCNWLERNCGQDPLATLEICEKLVVFHAEGDGLRFSSEMASVLLEVLKEADETNDPKLIARAVKLQDEFLRMDVTGVDELLDNAVFR